MKPEYGSKPEPKLAACKRVLMLFSDNE